MKPNLNNILFVKSSKKPEDLPLTFLPEIVFLGRSNVGKSSFINSILERKQNKIAFTSSTPGKTQLINFFEIDEKLMFVDVPGYGYAKVSKIMREEFGVMIDSYLRKRQQLELAVLLIDMKVGPTNDDLVMLEYLLDNEITTMIVLTKSDKIKKNDLQKQLKVIEEKIHKVDSSINKEDFFPYSTETKISHDDIWEVFENFVRVEEK